MPSVGTLNLTVESNASTVGGDLKEIAGALRSIKSAIPANGLGLPELAGEIKTFASTIKTIESSSSAFKSIESLGVGLTRIANFLKYSTSSVKESTDGLNKSISTIDTSPAVTAIGELKTAIGDGLKLNQAGTQLKNIKEALGGEWNTENAKNAGEALKFIADGASGLQGVSLGTQAKNISAMAGAISDYAKSIEELKASAGIASSSSVSDSVQTAQSVSAGSDVVAGYTQSILQGKQEVAMAGAEMAQAAIEAVRSTNDSHSPSRVYRQLGEDAVAGYIEGVRDKIDEAANILADMTKAAIISAKDAAPQAAKEMADAITGTISTMMSGVELPNAVKDVMIKAAKEAGDFTKNLVATSSKENYGVAAEMASSAVWATITAAANGAFDSMKKLEEGVVQVRNEVQTAGKAIDEKVTEGIQSASTSTEALRDNLRSVNSELSMMSAAKPYKTIEDAFNGISFGRKRDNDLMASWLHGNGTNNEQLYAVQKMATEFGMTVDEVKAKLNELLMASGTSFKFTIAEDMAKENADMQQANTTIAEHTSLIRELKSELEGASFKGLYKSLATDLKGLGSSMKAMFPTITGLVKRFKSMLIMRSMRYLVRQLAAGLNEGIKNLYNYSEAIKGDFATSMDNAATSLLLMKNSIGAALGPAIQALIPILQNVVNWFVNVMNVVNQFIALITGHKTWTKAIEYQTKAYQDNTKKAKNAAKAAKELLADWDELNIIQSKNTGNGGSGSGKKEEDYSKMFEEVSEFSEKIKRLVSNIKEQFGSVWNLIKRIGLAILGWKFSNAFTGILGALGGLIGSVLTIGLVFDVSTLFTKQYLQTGDKYWLLADVLTTLVGGVFMRKILSKVAGGAMADIAIPLTFAVSAAASLIALVKETDVSALSEEGILTAMNTALKGGIAAGSALYLLGGTTLGMAAGYGAGIGIFTFGASIGIKTIADVIDTGEITSDTILGNLISASAVGAGLSIASWTILGSSGTVGTILGTGLMGSLFTLGALVLTELIIDSLPEKIKWGDEKMTEDQVKEFVDGKVFTVDIKTRMDLAAEAVRITDEKKTALKEKTQRLLGLVDAVKLGVDVEESLKEIDDQINNSEDGLVKRFKDMQKEKKNQLTLAISSIQIVDDTGADQSSDIAKVFGEGWNTLDTVMTNLGKRLAEAVSKSYNEALTPEAREMAKNTVLEITQAMMDISAINTANQTAIDLRNNFTEGLKGYDQSSVQSLLDYYNLRKDEAAEFAKSQYQVLLDEAELQQANYKDLAAKAKENGGEFAGFTEQYYLDMAKQFEDMYANLKAYRDRSIEASLAFYQEGGEGLDMIRGYILDLIKDQKKNVSLFNMEDLFFENTRSIFSGKDSVLLGNKAKDNVQQTMKDVILKAFNPGDQPVIESALDAGVLKYTDFLNKGMMDALARELGISGELKELWDRYVLELLGEDPDLEVTTGKALPEYLEEVKASAKEKVDKIKETVQGVFKHISDNEESIKAQPKIEIDPVADMSETKERFRKLIDEALSDKVLSAEEKANIVKQFGQVAYDRFIRELGYNFEEWNGGWRIPENTGTNMLSQKPIRVSGSMGVSDVGWTRPGTTGEQEAGGIDYSQMETSVKNGATSANNDVVSELRTAVQVLQRILAKPWVVNVQATSGLGRTVNESNRKYGNVTGDTM